MSYCIVCHAAVILRGFKYQRPVPHLHHGSPCSGGY